MDAIGDLSQQQKFVLPEAGAALPFIAIVSECEDQLVWNSAPANAGAKFPIDTAGGPSQTVLSPRLSWPFKMSIDEETMWLAKSLKILDRRRCEMRRNSHVRVRAPSSQPNFIPLTPIAYFAESRFVQIRKHPGIYRGPAGFNASEIASYKILVAARRSAGKE